MASTALSRMILSSNPLAVALEPILGLLVVATSAVHWVVVEHEQGDAAHYL